MSDAEGAWPLSTWKGLRDHLCDPHGHAQRSDLVNNLAIDVRARRVLALDLHLQLHEESHTASSHA